jgi:heptosyltransferase-1
MTSQRYLIVRTSAIGDVVFASGLPAAIKRAQPKAHITWLVEPGIHKLLLPDPNIDEVIPWSKSEWVRLWAGGRKLDLLRSILKLRRELRQRKFDVALDLQGLMKSGFLTWLSGARRRIGLGSKEGSQWLMTEVLPRGGDKRRIGSEYRFLAERLAFDVEDFLPRLFISAETDSACQTMMQAYGLHTGQYAVFAPFTTRPQKHWFEDAWQALARRVRDELGLTPVILGGPSDKVSAEQIAHGLPGVLVLTGATALPEAAALIRQAGLLVGVDTGLTHMGSAFGTPTIALFGSTCPYLETGRSNARVIWLGMDCSPCRRRPTCGGAFTCLRNITAEQVMEAAFELRREAIGNK